jgi:hypothetical protein
MKNIKMRFGKGCGILHNDMGTETVLHLIASFNGAKDVGSDLQFSNLLAWWACEDMT